MPESAVLYIPIREPPLRDEFLDVVPEVLGVSIDAPRVRHNERVGGDEVPVVDVVVLDTVRDGVGHDGSPAHDLAQEGVDVGQFGAIDEVGQAVGADDLVELGLGLAD